MIKLNLNRDLNKEFEQIEPGEYEVTACNFEARTAGDKNIISFDYEIRADVDQPGKGQKIRFDDFFCTEKALWKIENASIAAGFTEAEASFEKYGDWAKAFLNKNLRVEVELEPSYKDPEKKFPKVKRYLPSEAALGNTEVEVKDSQLPF